MATYKGICKLTDKEETIWFDMTEEDTMHHKSASVGLMITCTVCERTGIVPCPECSLYQELLT